MIIRSCFCCLSENQNERPDPIGFCFLHMMHGVGTGG